MQVTEMKTKLEEKIKALESEKAAGLETEVGKLREDVKALREKIPAELMSSE
jgi:hypothetical protein